MEYFIGYYIIGIVVILFIHFGTKELRVYTQDNYDKSIGKLPPIRRTIAHLAVMTFLALVWPYLIVKTA